MTSALVGSRVAQPLTSCPVCSFPFRLLGPSFPISQRLLSRQTQFQIPKFSSAKRQQSTMSASLPAGTRALPAIFARGGTSNGLVLHARDLPSDRSLWRDVLAPAMGSPDPLHGRQLDGMGGGLSSTSKVCVISPRGRDPEAGDGVDADVDFTFVQVGVRDGTLDLGGNCGNSECTLKPLSSFVRHISRAVIDLHGSPKAQRISTPIFCLKIRDYSLSLAVTHSPRETLLI